MFILFTVVNCIQSIECVGYKTKTTTFYLNSKFQSSTVRQPNDICSYYDGFLVVIASIKIILYEPTQVVLSMLWNVFWNLFSGTLTNTRSCTTNSYQTVSRTVSIADNYLSELRLIGKKVELEKVSTQFVSGKMCLRISCTWDHYLNKSKLRIKPPEKTHTL